MQILSESGWHNFSSRTIQPIFLDFQAIWAPHHRLSSAVRAWKQPETIGKHRRQEQGCVAGPQALGVFEVSVLPPLLTFSRWRSWQAKAEVLSVLSHEPLTGRSGQSSTVAPAKFCFSMCGPGQREGGNKNEEGRFFLNAHFAKEKRDERCCC